MSEGQTIELELKFRLARPLTAAEIDALDWSPYRLDEAVEQQLDDTILDTPDEQIIGAGCSFRVRRLGERAIVTLKGPRQGDGHLHQREEVEVETTPETIARGEWPPLIKSALARMVPEASGDGFSALSVQPSALGPALHLRNRRVIWHLRRAADGRPVAELALDTGAYLVDDRESPFHELEVELIGGDRTDLLAIETRLAELPIVPEPKSKLEQGLAFRAEVRAQRVS